MAQPSTSFHIEALDPLEESSLAPSVPDNTLLQQNNILLKTVLRELKVLRRENAELKKMVEKSQEMSALSKLPEFQLDLPASTIDHFLILENDIKTDHTKEDILSKIFERIPEQSIDKFVRGCLKTVIIDEVACNFSWFGRHDNIPVEGYVIMTLIKEAACNKFPAARIIDVNNTIKKWFQYAKDRVRKANQPKWVYEDLC